MRTVLTCLTLAVVIQTPLAEAQEGSNTPQTPAASPPDIVKISMPASQFGACDYELAAGSASWSYTISPGQVQQLKSDRVWKIKFDRGLTGAPRSYQLTPGHYRFRQTPQGWDLFRTNALETTDAGPPPLAPVPLTDG